METATITKTEAILNSVPDSVVSTEETNVELAATEIEANRRLLDAPMKPEMPQVAVNNKDETKTSRWPKFSDHPGPSHPLCEPAVQAAAKDTTNEEPQAREVVPKDTVIETPLVPVTVMAGGEEEMNQLHRQVVDNGRTTLLTGIDLGEILTKVKASKARAWGKWFENAQLEFDIRTAQIYMRLHKNREALLEKYAAVSHLGIKGACRMLAKPSKHAKAQAVSDDSQTEGTIDDGVEINETVKAGVTLEPANGVELDAESDALPMTKEIVAELTVEQSTRVLEFITEVGIEPSVWDSLTKFGGIIRLKVQDDPLTVSDTTLVPESSTVAVSN
jgi:hypothetical protein